jgi:hypothetical protein
MLAMFHTHKDFPLRRQPIREALEALLTEHPIRLLYSFIFLLGLLHGFGLQQLHTLVQPDK